MSTQIPTIRGNYVPVWLNIFKPNDLKPKVNMDVQCHFCGKSLAINCYEGEDHEDFAMLPCGHVFGYNCITEHFSRDHSCPKCSKSMIHRGCGHAKHISPVHGSPFFNPHRDLHLPVLGKDEELTELCAGCRYPATGASATSHENVNTDSENRAHLPMGNNNAQPFYAQAPGHVPGFQIHQEEISARHQQGPGAQVTMNNPHSGNGVFYSDNSMEGLARFMAATSIIDEENEDQQGSNGTYATAQNHAQNQAQQPQQPQPLNQGHDSVQQPPLEDHADGENDEDDGDEDENQQQAGGLQMLQYPSPEDLWAHAHYYLERLHRVAVNNAQVTFPEAYAVRTQIVPIMRCFCNTCQAFHRYGLTYHEDFVPYYWFDAYGNIESSLTRYTILRPSMLETSGAPGTYESSGTQTC
ncbi:hypothetical protein GGS21DRAFT_489675 [Xylaria nigripes]|nr:hypothetical protein GGS21DRAFT_489675 [Xylaria nigripes]